MLCVAWSRVAPSAESSSQSDKDQRHDRHFRHCWKHPRGPFLGKAREVDFATPEEARWRRRSAPRSAKLSDAVLRSVSNAGHAWSPGFRARGRSEMDRRGFELDGALRFFLAWMRGRGRRGCYAACTAGVPEIRIAARTRPLALRFSASGHASRARGLGSTGQLGRRSPARLPEHLGDESERAAIPRVAAWPPPSWARRRRGNPSDAGRSLSRRSRAWAGRRDLALQAGGTLERQCHHQWYALQRWIS